MADSPDPTPADPNAPRPVIAVSMGDAAGVGPELCLYLLARKRWPEGSVPLIVGSERVLKRVAKKLGKTVEADVVTELPAAIHEPTIFDVPGALKGVSVSPGRIQAPCGEAAAMFIRHAVEACRSGLAGGMTTAPISKKALSLAGIEFPGHAEMIAHLTGAREIAMLLYSEHLAVTFVTSHQALRSVPDALTLERIVQVTTLLNRFLMLLRDGRKPRIAVLGLNPHAGENGLFGSEEEVIVEPAVQRLKSLGLNVEGPLPPDTAFTPDALKNYDGHVALYHDQGSIPFKMFAFDTGVNVTMGLEIIRTSPDHGTAYDIAWKGKAKTKSFMEAYALAARLAAAQRRDLGGRRSSSRRLSRSA